MSDESKLVITDAEGHESTFLLGQAVTWKIGRAPNNNIVLDDHGASRRHAMIQRTEMGEFYLMDVGSQNGTFVGCHRVATPVVLNDGDEILIGAHKLKFHNPTPSMSGEVLAPGQQDLSGTNILFSERLVTVLVVDIRGFTQVTQNISQDVLCNFITRWFSDASSIFREHGSWALKYIGDAVMGAWVHDPGKDSEPILSVLKAIAEFAAKASSEQYSLPFPLRFGAGVNTGLASVGNAGSGDQADFTAFGDAVNAAFRIEAATRQLDTDIAIGQTTAGLLGGTPFMKQCFQDHRVTLKGYDTPVTVWAGSFDDLRNLLFSSKTS